MLTRLGSALLIIGLPVVFWLGVLEAADYAFALALTLTFKLIVAAILLAMLVMIWRFIEVSVPDTHAAVIEPEADRAVDGLRSPK